MKPVWMYLDEAQARGLAANDSDIAAKLGVTKAAVCDWRKGRTAPAEDAAAKLAALLSKQEVMAECAAARAKTPEGRKMWEKLARIAAAAVVLMVSSVGTHISNGFDGQYAPRIPMNTVIRSARTYAARSLAGLSIRFRRIFRHCEKVCFAEVAQ